MDTCTRIDGLILLLFVVFTVAGFVLGMALKSKHASHQGQAAKTARTAIDGETRMHLSADSKRKKN
jgi:hypothetical protein